MKLEKLITLSEFVDYVQSEIPDDFTRKHLSPEQYESAAYKTIIEYNNFLKQPLTKDYAIELISINDGLIYLDDNYPGVICIKNGGCIPFGWKISDLAVVTKGKLTINLEL